MSDDPTWEAYEDGYADGAAVAVGLIQMAEAIRLRRQKCPGCRCMVFIGSAECPCCRSSAIYNAIDDDETEPFL